MARDEKRKLENEMGTEWKVMERRCGEVGGFRRRR